MITEIDIANSLTAFLGAEVDARIEGDRIRVLTPVEYPDGDGVVICVAPAERGLWAVTDGGAADALLAGHMSRKALQAPASAIAGRFDVAWNSGQLRDDVASTDIAQACWRVAQASAAVAEAITFHRQQPQKEAEFADVIARELRQHKIPVETDRKLEGASGHTHTASIFVPPTETVIEPVTGERAWNTAMSIYVEFGDLSQVNGYKLVAVVDDRESAVGADVLGLLGQVADVASWRQHAEWIIDVGGSALS